jgi:hypothetical protein
VRPQAKLLIPRVLESRKLAELPVPGIPFRVVCGVEFRDGLKQQPGPLREAVLTAEEPLAHFHKEFDFRDVRLDDLAITQK